MLIALRSTWNRFALATALLLFAASAARAQEPLPRGSGPAGIPAAAEGPEARAAAVALNYSRAAFHRIRKYPSKRILLEERDQILNNLDLNGIADEEVIKLYTAVLAEISDVQIAERERQLIAEQFQRQLERQLFNSAWTLTTQVAAAEYLGAVKTGANSWWDYRALVWQKDYDAWKVDKARLVGIVDKSALFLDTFWKQTRKRGIPDRWLVRGDDLDRLEAALREPEHETRLRVLKRMEPYMECYPPYWYYVARTQQSLGQMFAASQTYDKMERLGEGHFRRDEMLAAGLANLAMIQEYLRQPSAHNAALRALDHATTVWEVNLACASVLERHGLVDEAEDAILRNLDVGLEREQSRSSLVALYSKWGRKQKLVEALHNAETLQQVPPPLLASAAVSLGDSASMTGLGSRLAESLACYPDLRFGKDDFVILGVAGWDLASVQMTLTVDGQTYDAPKVSTTKNGSTEVRFRNVGELGTPLKSQIPPSIVLTLTASQRAPVKLALQNVAGSDAAGDGDRAWLPLPISLGSKQSVWRITGVTIGDHNVTFQGERATGMTVSARE